MRSMQALFDAFSRQAEKILVFAGETRNYVEGVYSEFHKMYSFPKMTPPALNLERHILRMHSLHQSTERFCKDPVNVMTEKHFLVRRFYGGLVAHARELFTQLRLELDAWVNSALTPLSMQLKEHQKLLERRVDNLRKVAGDINTLQERVRQLEDSRRAESRSRGDEGGKGRLAARAGISPRSLASAHLTTEARRTRRSQ